MMLMILGGVRAVIARAELEHMTERRNQEEQQLEKQFLSCTDAKQEWNDEHELQLDYFDDQD